MTLATRVSAEDVSLLTGLGNPGYTPNLDFKNCTSAIMIRFYVDITTIALTRSQVVGSGLQTLNIYSIHNTTTPPRQKNLRSSAQARIQILRRLFTLIMPSKAQRLHHVRLIDHVAGDFGDKGCSHARDYRDHMTGWKWRCKKYEDMQVLQQQYHPRSEQMTTITGL